MLFQKPPIHGRDHRPGGADPLPEVPYMAGVITLHTITSASTVTSVDFDPATAAWGTDAGPETASPYFALQQSGGAGPYKVAILANSLYIIDVSVLMESTSAPAAGSVATVTISGGVTTIDNNNPSPWLTALSGGANYTAQPSFRAWLNWPASYATPPIRHLISIGQNSGNTISTAIVSFLVVRIGAGNTGF